MYVFEGLETASISIRTLYFNTYVICLFNLTFLKKKALEQ